jgi:predicted ATPase
VLIDGEAGIGKSRLLERFTELVRERQGQLLEGACVPFLQTVPYAPVLRIVEALTSESSLSPSPVANSLLPDPTRRSQFFHQVGDGLAASAAEAPLAIMVEDLHWADEATADLLLFLARGIKRLPVLLVLTRRSDELSRAGRLDAALAELERGGHAERIRLTPLDRRQPSTC